MISSPYIINGSATLFQYVLPINTLLQLLLVTDGIMIAYLVASWMDFFFCSYRKFFLFVIFIPKYFISFATLIPSMLSVLLVESNIKTLLLSLFSFRPHSFATSVNNFMLSFASSSVVHHLQRIWQPVHTLRY